MYINDLNFELAELESAESVDFARAATATSYEDITSVDARAENRLSGLLSLGRAQKEKLEHEKRLKNQNAFKKYYKQGELRDVDHQNRPDPDLPDLTYRCKVHQQRQSQKQFLNSILHRVQVKPALFVCDLG